MTGKGKPMTTREEKKRKKENDDHMIMEMTM